MRKVAVIIVTFVLLLSSAALAEGWICPTCGNDATGNFCNLCGTANSSNEWTCPQCKAETKGNFCNNCGSPRPKGATQNNGEVPEPVPTAAPTAEPNSKSQDAVVKNYTGRSLSLCGYTSMGGERRDKYAGTTLELIMQSTDGSYIDPNDDDALEAYKVVAQYPAADTPFTVTTNLEGKQVNPGYGEIVLIVSKDGDSTGETPTLTALSPSPGKTTQYVRDYRGRVLEDVGYTSMGGKRMDQYGPSGYVQLIIIDEDGQKLDPTKHDDFIYYVVLDQDVEPNTKMTFTYSDDKCTGQTIDIIQITVAMTETGRATLDALAAEEEELRASGALQDLYKGTYEVGKDLVAGNYEFTQISSSCDLYIYADKEALDNGSGEWCYLYGSGDKETWYLRDGMYVKIDDGAAKAKRSDFSTSGTEFLLFSGVYRVGEDIAPGSYEMTHYTASCDVNLYQNETAYQEDNGDWDYLYGKGDTEYYVLQEEMVIKISDGAASVTRK